MCHDTQNGVVSRDVYLFIYFCIWIVMLGLFHPPYHHHPLPLPVVWHLELPRKIWRHINFHYYYHYGTTGGAPGCAEQENQGLNINVDTNLLPPPPSRTKRQIYIIWYFWSNVPKQPVQIPCLLLCGVMLGLSGFRYIFCKRSEG